jgi:hypothetical protein
MASGTPDGSSGALPVRRRRANAPDLLTMGEILLSHEFEQAWQHYRQNETLRSQYLGYFFALVLGSAAFGAQTVRSRALSSPVSLILFEVFLLTLALLSCFVYLGVRRAGIALAHYEAAWNAIRDYFYSSIDRRVEPYCSLNIRDSGHKILSYRWTGMQPLSECVIALLSLFIVIFQIGLFVRLILINAAWWEQAIGVGILAVTLTAPILVIASAGTSFRGCPNN